MQRRWQIASKKVVRMEYNKELKDKNSFGFNITAKRYVEFSKAEELPSIFEEIANDNYIILGGGSNILFTDNYNGVVIHPVGKSTQVITESETDIFIRAEAGVVWDDFVSYCTDKGYYGAENLSAIPGSVGASPVQNIGAYGVEAKDIINSVEYYDIDSGEIRILSNKECAFGYRNSIFKTKVKGVVTAVCFKLSKLFNAVLSYSALKDRIKKEDITAAEIRTIICDIRDSKLPNPALIGNGGSFFKNPVVTKEKFEELISKYPTMPSYADALGVKLSAAWLIDNDGWRGYRDGAVGVHDKQALVLVHYGDGCGSEIVALAKKIIDSVNSRYGVILTPEVIIC